ncbi:MAG: hypothetical protein ABII00_02450 [Elusimicrobiota bacterium]
MTKLTVSKRVYSEEALKLAANVFSRRAQAEFAEAENGWEVTLLPRSRRASKGGRVRRPPGVDAGPRARGLAELKALEGEFLNELLSQEYRVLVSGFNKRIAGVLVTQALFSARGGENPPKPPKESAAFKKEAAKLLREAKEETHG